MLEALQAVEIEINHSCNRACTYCPNSVTKRKTQGFMETALYSKILDNLEEIQFQGRLSYHFYNEPLLHPNLTQYVELTKRRLPNVQLHLYSNGTLLTYQKFSQLRLAGVDKFIITRHMKDEKSPSYVFDSTYRGLSEGEKNSVVYRSFKEVQLFNRGGILKTLGSDGLPLHPCHLPSHMLTVTVDGRILSCFEDFHEHQVFGDLKTEKLVDIWRRDSYIQFRKHLKAGLRHLHEPCKNCNRNAVLPSLEM